MDEPWLRDLLDRAIASEPPVGPLAANSLRAGIKLRRRRRVQGTAACLAAAALVGTGAVAATGAAGHPATGRAKVTGPSTVYVLSSRGTLTPIPTATNVPGKPIPIGDGQIMAITPNGKTIYVGDDYVADEEPNQAVVPAVVPVSTVTDTAGKPIQTDGQVPSEILITPNGKTAYVLPLGGNEIIPIATATNTLEKPIRVGTGLGGPYQMAITPNGKTLYVTWYNTRGAGPTYVVPISTATNTREKSIKIQNADVNGILMNPDGRTLYAFAQSPGGTEIIPIATATNTAGKPVNVGTTEGAMYIAPDGQTLYLVRWGVKSQPTDVIPFATGTSTPGKPIKIGGLVYAIAVTPDGATAYFASEPRQKPVAFCTGRTGEVTPVPTATNVPGRPIRVGCDPVFLAVTPDGKTVWVGSRDRITPISTATNTAGRSTEIPGTINAIVVAVTP